MKILLIDNGTTLLRKLEELIPGHEIVKKFDSSDLDEIEEFDLVVLSGGGKHNVEYEHKLFVKEQKLIRAGKPVIGICFGCELIAYEFRGTLKKLEASQKGIYEIKIDAEELGGPKVIEVYEGHSWGIDRLPADFEVLAESFSGPEIIKHVSAPIYGIQFHPESMVEETEGDELFLKILKNLNLK
jgi:GMP synthase-like glutamine amidotransferase